MTPTTFLSWTYKKDLIKYEGIPKKRQSEKKLTSGNKGNKYFKGNKHKYF